MIFHALQFRSIVAPLAAFMIKMYRMQPAVQRRTPHVRSGNAGRCPARVRGVAVPTYVTLMRPTLAALADGRPWTRGQLREAVATASGVSDDDLSAMLPSGKATVFGSRVGWALTYMSQAGLATRPKRGVYVITDRGLKVLDEQPDRIDNKVLQQFPEFLEFKARRNEKGEPVGTNGEASGASVSALSPTEAI